MNQEEMIKTYFSNLKENELMLISGGSFEGIFKAIRQAVINALNSGKRVAIFESENGKDGGMLPFEEQGRKKRGWDLLSIFYSMNFRIGDVEVSNGYSLSLNNIVQEVESKKNTNEQYDLVVIVDAEVLPELTSFKSPGEIAGKIKKMQKRIGVPVIFSLQLTNKSFRAFDYISNRDKLFHSVRNFIDFLIRIDDDEIKGKSPLEFDVKLYECRNREIDASFFLNKDDHRFYLKDENVANLFNKALGLGLEKEDAIVYATYWNKNESAGYKNDDN